MADITLAVQEPSRAGLEAVYTGGLTTTDRYLFPNNGRTILHFKKGASGDAVLSVVSPLTVDGLAVADLAVTVLENTERFIGAFPPGTFSDPNQSAAFTLAGIDNLSVAVLRLP